MTLQVGRIESLGSDEKRTSIKSVKVPVKRFCRFCGTELKVITEPLGTFNEFTGHPEIVTHRTCDNDACNQKGYYVD